MDRRGVKPTLLPVTNRGVHYRTVSLAGFGNGVPRQPNHSAPRIAASEEGIKIVEASSCFGGGLRSMARRISCSMLPMMEKDPAPFATPGEIHQGVGHSSMADKLKFRFGPFK
jgi:hypothetical protein